MTAFLLALSSVITAVLLWTAGTDARTALSAVLVVMGWALFYDCARAKCALEALIEPESAGKRRTISDLTGLMVTAAGKSFARAFDSVQVALRQRWSESEAPSGSVHPASPEQSPSEDEGTTVISPADRALEKFRLKVGVKAAAIVSFEPAGNVSVRVQTGGSERLSRQLREFFSSYFSGQDSSLLGFRDGFHSNSLLGEFSAFGFRYTWSARLSPDIDNTFGPAVLWVGFGSGFVPGEREMRLISSLVPGLEQELVASTKISVLEERVVAAERGQRANSEVIAHLSHDLRSPLSNIKGILHVLQLEQLEPSVRDMLEVALNNCESVADLIQGLLDYSRYQFGRLPTRPEDTSFPELVSGVVRSFSVSAAVKGLSLTCVIEEDAPGLVRIDASQVKRVVSNIISNAIKYTQYGSIQVCVAKGSGGRVKLQVSDTGLGMSSEQLERLFTPFTRFHEGAAEGVGLGLALTKILVELNGGAIAVQSVEGRGSQFSIEFPCSEQNTSGRMLLCGSGTQVVSPQPRPLSGMRVLIVDDDPDCVKTLARALSSFGVECYQSVSVQDALSIINFEDLHAVISDSSMPGGGCGSIVRAVNSRLTSTPVLILSGDVEIPMLHAPAGSGRMTKPADIEAVVRWLQGVYNRASVSNGLLAGEESEQKRSAVGGW